MLCIITYKIKIMKTNISTLIFILSSFFAFNQDVPDGFSKVVSEFETAINSSDASAISNLFTSDGVSQESGGEVLSGHTAIMTHYKEVFSQVDYSDGKISVNEIIELAPDVYYSRGTFKATITIKANDQSIPATSYWANVSEVNDGVWKIKRHMLAIPAKR